MSEFTVAICTYKRADILPATLDSLAACDRPDANWDVLIVDNACESDVQRVVDDFRERHPDIAIRYTSESQTGIARARNRAVEAAEAPFILFADDDVLFDPRWLASMIAAIREHDGCDFWGGRIEPTWPTQPPRWLDLRYCPMMGDAIVRYDAGSEPRPWDPKRDSPFYTCNLALRTEAIRRAGMFDVTLGHMGKQRGAGEDTLMIKTIARQGGAGWYAADALLRHPVPPDRVSKAYFRGFAKRQGYVSIDMLLREQSEDGQPTGKPPRWVVRHAAQQWCRGVGQWLAGTLTCNAARRFAGGFRVRYNAAKLRHALRTRHV